MSQSDFILAYLRTGWSLTPPEAIKLFDCHRLGARIYDLRSQGHRIHADRVGRFARYYWIGGPRGKVK
jgi:hypothetical protein